MSDGGLHLPANFWRSVLYVLVIEAITLTALWFLQTSFNA